MNKPQSQKLDRYPLELSWLEGIAYQCYCGFTVTGLEHVHEFEEHVKQCQTGDPSPNKS